MSFLLKGAGLAARETGVLYPLNGYSKGTASFPCHPNKVSPAPERSPPRATGEFTQPANKLGQLVVAFVIVTLMRAIKAPFTWTNDEPAALTAVLGRSLSAALKVTDYCSLLPPH